jgi:hypothetical protein
MSCSFFLGENIPTAEFGMILAETAFWAIEENSQIFNEDFYLPLYLPLLYGTKHRVGRVLSVSPVVGIGTPPPL